MKFALLGDHPDGLDMTHAMTLTKRHQLSVYCGPPAGEKYLQRWGLSYQRIGDIEEVLADPAIATVIVAGKTGARFAQVRRALQAEKHVLCVHPIDSGPDAAFEADLVRKEYNCLLLPLLPQPLHPAFERIAQMMKQERQRQSRPDKPSAAPRLLQMDFHSTESLLLNWDDVDNEPGFPVWDVLRFLGGEIIEVSAYAQFLDVNPDDAVGLCGSFDKGGIFHVTLLPYQPESKLALSLHLSNDRVELLFPEGFPGPASLHWRDESDQLRDENWENWNPWDRLVDVFEETLSQPLAAATPANARSTDAGPSTNSGAPLPAVVPVAPAKERQREVLSWQDEIRCLELDQAARRSIAQRRCSTLEYQEAVEEASFKGTMTLVGCGMLWLGLILLIASVWVNHLFWVMLPLLAVFLILQMLRWIVPSAKADKSNDRIEKPS